MIKKRIIILAIILTTISCSSNSNKKSLSEQQFQDYVDLFPDYPRLDKFSKEDKIKIASLPPIFKEWVFETLKIVKCLKNNLCE